MDGLPAAEGVSPPEASGEVAPPAAQGGPPEAVALKGEQDQQHDTVPDAAGQNNACASAQHDTAPDEADRGKACDSVQFDAYESPPPHDLEDQVFSDERFEQGLR